MAGQGRRQGLCSTVGPRSRNQKRCSSSLTPQTAWRLARLDDECPESARECVSLRELLLPRLLCL